MVSVPRSVAAIPGASATLPKIAAFLIVIFLCTRTGPALHVKATIEQVGSVAAPATAITLAGAGCAGGVGYFRVRPGHLPGCGSALCTAAPAAAVKGFLVPCHLFSSGLSNHNFTSCPWSLSPRVFLTYRKRSSRRYVKLGGNAHAWST